VEKPTALAGLAARQLRVESLRRYPVKSMLGESVDSLFVDEGGAEGDRRLALIDTETGHVASAKHARLWRGLLKCTAHAGTGRVNIELPDGTSVAAAGTDGPTGQAATGRRNARTPRSGEVA